MDDFLHIVRLGATLDRGDDHHFLPGQLHDYDLKTGDAQVTLDIYRNHDSAPGVTQPSPVLTPGTGIQCIPNKGDNTVAAVLEGEEGYFAVLGYFISPLAQTPSQAILGSVSTPSLDSTVTFSQSDNTSAPGDIIMRHPAGGTVRLTATEFSIQMPDGSGFRIANGQIMMLSQGGTFIQAGGQIGMWSTADMDLHAGGDIDMTAEQNWNVQVQKDIIITSAEGSATLQTLTDDINIQSGKDLKLSSENDMNVIAGNDLSINAILTTFAGLNLEFHNVHQVYGFQAETNDIAMYAGTWQAVGAQHLNLGNNQSDTINIRATNLLNMRAPTTVLDGDTHLGMYGSAIVLGIDPLNVDAAMPEPPQSVTIGAQTVNMYGSTNNTGGSLTIQGANHSDILLHAQNIYSYANLNSAYVAGGDNWLVGAGRVNLAATFLNLGTSGSQPIPGPASNPHPTLSPITADTALYANTFFAGSGASPGGYMTTFNVKATNQVMDALSQGGGAISLFAATVDVAAENPGANLKQLLSSAALDIYNEHIHTIGSGDGLEETSPPIPTMPSSVLTSNLFADAGGGGGGGGGGPS